MSVLEEDKDEEHGVQTATITRGIELTLTP